jgi:hypothetical protein
MLIGSTAVVTVFWLAFLWFVDPDGFRNAARNKSDVTPVVDGEMKHVTLRDFQRKER